MATYLDRILTVHRTRAEEDSRPVEELAEAARRTPEPRPFRQALGRDGMAVIAELKRRSPSRGDLAIDLYAGVGFFTLPLTKAFQRVVSVDANLSATRNLRENADTADRSISGSIVICFAPRTATGANRLWFRDRGATAIVAA